MEAMNILVNGEWRQTSIKRQVFNPFENKAVGEICQATSRDIDDAIRSAETAFHLTKNLSPYERSAALDSVSRSLAEKKEEFAQLITAETGKPISFSRAEVERAVFTIATSAEEARRIEGHVLPLDVVPQSGNRAAIIRRFPLGEQGVPLRSHAAIGNVRRFEKRLTDGNQRQRRD